MYKRYNEYKKDKCSYSTFYKRIGEGQTFHKAIKPVNRYKYRTYKKYYSEGKGYTIFEIIKLSGKSNNSILQYIYRNPNTRTIDKIKSLDRRTSANKLFVKGVPMKKRCDAIGISYQAGYRMMLNGSLIVDAV